MSVLPCTLSTASSRAEAPLLHKLLHSQLNKLLHNLPRGHKQGVC